MTDREQDIAVIEDHKGGNRYTDETILADVIRKLGWDAFTDEALALMAGGYERAADFRERINAENRARREKQDRAA
jgi:hypothetical protein